MSLKTEIIKTQSDWQRVITELAFISRSDITLGDFLQKFLQTTLTGLGASGGAFWFPANKGFQCAYHINVEQLECETNALQKQCVNNALTDIVKNQRPLLVGPRDTHELVSELKEGQIVNFTEYPLFYIPIVSGEAAKKITLHAILQVWLPATRDPRTYNEVISFLQLAARQGAAYLRVHALESQISNSETMEQFVRFLTELAGENDLERLGITIVNWGRQIIGCDRCALFVCKGNGKLRALAISNVDRVNPKSALVQCQKVLAQEALNAKAPTLFAKSSPKSETVGDISDYFYHSHANEALVLPLLGPDKAPVGVLLVEGHMERQIDKDAQRLSQAIASRASTALMAASEISALPMIGTLRRVAKVRNAWHTQPRKRFLLKTILPIVILAAVLFCPIPFKLQSDCVIVPLNRAQAVAETPGRITSVLVKEGTKVKAGDVLATLDDIELRNNLHIAEQEKIRYETEANKEQAKGDEAASQVMRIEAARMQRQVDQIQRDLGRAKIKSPIDGVVLTRDPESRIGEVLPLGGRFCEIGDTSTWEIHSRVSESETGILDQAFQKKDVLPVSFLLRSMPDRKFSAVMRGRSAISQVSTPVPGDNIFVVRAEVVPQPGLDTLLKTGFTGRSNIRVGWRPASYIAMRKCLNYIRVRWLF